MISIKRLIESNIRLETTTTNTLEVLRLELLDALKAQLDRHSSEPIVNIGDKLTEFSQEGIAVEKRQAILNSLTFRGMRWRYATIHKEHEETFQWIFYNSDISFLHWLTSQNGIYWIEGKAGSGKSTLMRYLVNVEVTKAALSKWAGNERLVIGSYFFWAAGNPMQRSQEGLLQTLVFQILRQCPDLISSVCPGRWDGLDSFHTGLWDYHELLEALNRLAKQQLSPVRFCFFVDGMDEFDGDQRALVELLKGLALSPSIKLCVSSRPWNIFVNAFEGVVPKLKLETLTQGDIRKYVNDKLGDEIRAEWDSQVYTEIVDQILTRARGVFLWVYLVVDSLLRGQEEGDNIRDVRRRLDSLPDDLEDFFRRILSKIDPFYREETARIFLVTIQSGRPLPAMAFNYLEQEAIDEHYALKARVAPIADSQVQQVSERMKKRLNARCRDLLETKIDPEGKSFFKYQVDFLHRTVRDFFLRTTAMEDLLVPEVLTAFNPALSLCRVMLALTNLFRTPFLPMKGANLLHL